MSEILINGMTIIETTDGKYVGMEVEISDNIDLGDFIFSYEKRMDLEDVTVLSTTSYVITLKGNG